MASSDLNSALPLPFHFNHISFSQLVSFGIATECHLDLWSYLCRSVSAKLVINVIRGKSAISVLFQVFVINSGLYQSGSLRTLMVVDSQRLSNAE
jgi:hypothetical protein